MWQFVTWNDGVLCHIESFQSHEVLFVNCFSQCLCYACLVKKVLFCVLRTILYFVVYQIQCTWFYGEVLVHLELNFLKADKYGSLCIHFHAQCLLKLQSFLWGLFLVYLSKLRYTQSCLELQWIPLIRMPFFCAKTMLILLLLFCSTT